MKSYGVTIQMKATEQYFPVVVTSLHWVLGVKVTGLVYFPLFFVLVV